MSVCVDGRIALVDPLVDLGLLETVRPAAEEVENQWRCVPMPSMERALKQAPELCELTNRRSRIQRLSQHHDAVNTVQEERKPRRVANQSRSPDTHHVDVPARQSDGSPVERVH